MSKTAEKGMFAAGLLALGGLVRWLIQRDEAETKQQTQKIRAEWGQPWRLSSFTKGFDTIRIEEYCRDKRRAILTYRNERLVRAEVTD